MYCGKILALAIAVGLFIGCASPNAQFNKGWNSALQKFHTGDYSQCVSEINRLFELDLTPHAESKLLLRKAICLEAIAQQEVADDIYKQIIYSFPNTTVADRALRRLERTDGDQKERIELKLGTNTWRLVSQDWSYVEVTQYYRKNDQPDVQLAIRSLDPREDIEVSIDTIVDRTTADLNLAETEFKILERSKASALIQVAPPRKGASILAVFAGPQRFHFVSIEVTTRRQVTPEELANWIAVLKTAHVAQGTLTPLQPNQNRI